MISSTTSTNDLATLQSLKARLDSVKKAKKDIDTEKKDIENDIKRVKQLAKTEKTEKASRSVSKNKKSDKHACLLTSEDIDTISSTEWNSDRISEWIAAEFPDSIDSEESADPWPQAFITKVRKHFDNPNSGDRTISTTIKPTLTKWTAYVTELPESKERKKVLGQIAFVTEIINQRRDFLKRERSSDIEVGSNNSQQPVKKAVSFPDGSMTNVEETDADPSDLVSAMSSLSISQDYSEKEQLLSLTLSQEYIEPKPVLSLSLPLVTEEFHDTSNEQEEEEEEEDDSSTPDYRNTSFVEGFAGHEMDCLEYDGFTSQKTTRGKTSMLIISYHSFRLATCVTGTNKWTYTDRAEIPLKNLTSDA